MYKNVDNVEHNTLEAPEEQRRRQLIYSDPVHRINVVEFVRGQLQNAIEAIGSQEKFHNDWIVNIDKDILQSFSKLGVF